MGADLVLGEGLEIRLVMASRYSYRCNGLDDWRWMWISDSSHFISLRDYRTGSL